MQRLISLNALNLNVSLGTNPQKILYTLLAQVTSIAELP
jgi:hypothetical protein